MIKSKCDLCNNEIAFKPNSKFKNGIEYNSKIDIYLKNNHKNEVVDISYYVCDDCYEVLSNKIITAVNSVKKPKHNKGIFGWFKKNK